MNTTMYRRANHEISSIFIDRWSPRAFATKPVEDEKLNSIFEAARWAPSAENWQPWRFIIAKTEADLESFHSFIFEGNLDWCKRVPVLVAIVSKTTRNA